MGFPWENGSLIPDADFITNPFSYPTKLHCKIEEDSLSAETSCLPINKWPTNVTTK